MSRRGSASRLMYASVALVLLLTSVLAVARPQPTAAAGVVSQCTEAALRAVVAGGGLVTFNCSGTILIADEIEISQDTVIDGGGVVTLDGQGLARLLHVAAGAELTLRGLTLTGGYGELIDSGGAIGNDGTLTIESSTVAGNSSLGFGGAIYNNGALTITDSMLSGNTTLGGAWGGAIFNNFGRVVTITSSTLSGNHSSEGFGGAIYNSGALTIIASTLSDNSSGSNGGAIFNGGALTITASTLSDNSSLTTSGGTIYHFGSGAVLTANILSSGSNLCVGDVMSSNGYNVASDSSCGLIGPGDVQNVNPLLGPLTNNGGPTETRMPLTGSPALDRVPNAVCVNLAAATNGRDQRGAPRPESAGQSCDSGSVEVQVNSFFCVGERSGSLRYISVPNGCVRGEFRLLPSAAGVYAFCVGDRSGSMRYLFNAGANCLRGETKLLLPQLEPTTICVGERSRTVRYVADAAACNPRGELPYVIVNPAG